MCLPKSLTIAQFTIIMLLLIFATAMGSMLLIYFIDYQQKAAPIFNIAMTALLFEAMILGFGAAGMAK
ncbi:hypothetical protein CPT_MyoSmar_021 [Serratia phage MyoSmar]|jgi:hypothetical protein|uniref:Uncharacterized protein n=1 Tax=Serratia phage MyoSmar TaxID=2596673 RepID=A0A5B9NBU3_9CAUD|nr:hypothetical protein HWC56_gp021 [Serratia phage MyoSmar]QEG09470.1 hypothetical protein CPT_MyoSmar_021 [Serratia phage MyoSmar]